MATFTWVGGTSSDWFDAANWSPQGTIPNDSGAIVTVNSDTNDANIINGGAITIGSLSVGGTGISAGQVIVGGSPEIGLGGGGSLTAQSIVLTSTDQNGALIGGPGGVVTAVSMTVAPNVAIGGGGTYDVTNIINNGLILADGGRPGLGLGPVVVQGSTISGTGNLEIDRSSTLEINAATSQSVTVAEEPTDVANLLLDSPGTFKGGVNLVNPNSQLNLFLKGQTPTGVSYDLPSGSLIITGAGGVLETIPLSSPNAITFNVVTSTIPGYGEVSINLDATAPTVTSVTASPSDAILGAGALVSLALNFGETMLVGTSGGTPTLSLNNGGTATYVSGSGTNALTFRYTVAAGQDTPDLGITAVNLNGATVTDQTGNAANLTGAVGSPPGTLAIEPTAVAGLDTTTGQPVPIVAKAYTGPVAGLQNEYINVTSHNLNIAAATPNWFIHTGSGDDAIAVSSGTNVLDGGTGSNFMTGGSGTDTFFVDDRAATADIWSTVNNFHAGDAATIWGVTAQDFGLAWTDGQGAAGFTGLTLHATAAGKPTASLTLTGYTSADLNNGRLSVSFGTDPASGSAYMYVHGNA